MEHSNEELLLAALVHAEVMRRREARLDAAITAEERMRVIESPSDGDIEKVIREFEGVAAAIKGRRPPGS